MAKKKAIRKKAGGRLQSWHKGGKRWYLTVPVFEDGEVKKNENTTAPAGA